MATPYRIFRPSIHEVFEKSRNKVQLFGGGFANGKTAAACALKILPVARDYPGANILVARSTYPKLNDTIRKEFLKWCPPHWIKSFPRSNNGSNTCVLINGTEINFRYIQQQGKASGESSSNLLSATYDLIVVDQMEDPEIEEKDFDDLLGRLRGNAKYVGDDPTMPKTGPRWMVLTCNPTRNWVYKRLVQPLHQYQHSGKVSEYLFCKRELGTAKPIRDDDGKVQLLIDLVEGSTYENKDNLGDDFIEALESSYTGQMRDRFLLGLWAAYEGLIYNEFDETIHSVTDTQIDTYIQQLDQDNYELRWLSGYDWGMAVQSCFIQSFVDPWGNVIIVDGFYKKEYSLGDQITEIKQISAKYGVGNSEQPWADPAIFRRGAGGKDIVGRSIADILYDGGAGIMMRRGNNSIGNGIVKVKGYLGITLNHQNPFTKQYGAPHIYFSDRLQWISDEFNNYVWNTNARSGNSEDKPRDGEDHAMDTLKYMLSRSPEASKVRPRLVKNTPAHLLWQDGGDLEPENNAKAYRYG